MPHREPLDELVIRPKGPMEVRSESNPNVSYDVTLPHCTCPDFRFRDHADDDEPHLCKHILGLHARMRGWRRASTTEEVAESLAQRQAAEILAALPNEAVADLLTAARTS